VGYGALDHSFQTAANYRTFISDRKNLDACTLLNSSHVAFSGYILVSSIIMKRDVNFLAW